MQQPQMGYSLLNLSKRGQPVEILPGGGSLLANGFNGLWCTALQEGYGYFAMLHADIAPEAGWIDVLMDELKEHKAHVCSAVVPIKDSRGLSSTGIGHPTRWNTPLRRLTMKECHSFPETFTAADAGYPELPLLVNTGCWMADLSDPRWRATNEQKELKIYFTIRDHILEIEPGIYRPGVQSEDWFFSCRVHEAGLKAIATRKVVLNHWGGTPHSNQAVWGQDVDEETRSNWESHAKENAECPVATAV